MRDDSPILATLAAAHAEGLTDEEIDRRVWARHGTTCAMLALDSSGMTRISHSLGIVHFLQRYRAMRDAAEPLLDGAPCLAWRCFADNLFAEFRDTDTALATALAIHRAVRAQGIMLTPTEPYRVCIGLGFGRVLANGVAGVMGDEMNLTAKLAEDIAAGGETLLTEAAYASLAQPAAVRVERLQLTISKVDVTYYRVCDA
jgi:class 3 adenylate cyclase